MRLQPNWKDFTFFYMYEYVFISQSVLVLFNHDYVLNPEDGAKHPSPWNPTYSLLHCGSLCLFSLGSLRGGERYQ